MVYDGTQWKSWKNILEIKHGAQSPHLHTLYSIYLCIHLWLSFSISISMQPCMLYSKSRSNSIKSKLSLSRVSRDWNVNCQVRHAHQAPVASHAMRPETCMDLEMVTWTNWHWAAADNLLIFLDSMNGWPVAIERCCERCCLDLFSRIISDWLSVAKTCTLPLVAEHRNQVHIRLLQLEERAAREAAAREWVAGLDM